MFYNTSHNSTNFYIFTQLYNTLQNCNALHHFAKTLQNFTTLYTTLQNNTSHNFNKKLYKSHHTYKFCQTLQDFFTNKVQNSTKLTQLYTTLYTKTLFNYYNTLQHFPTTQLQNYTQLYKSLNNFRKLYKLLQTFQHFTQLYNTLHNFTKQNTTLFKPRSHIFHNTLQPRKLHANSTTHRNILHNYTKLHKTLRTCTKLDKSL